MSGFDGLRDEIAKRRRKRLADGGRLQRFMQRHAQKVMKRQAQRANDDVLRTKFEDRTTDELCKIAVRHACLKAAATGALAGAIITGAELAAFVTFGYPIVFAFVIAIIEFAVLERMQIRMVFTLAGLRKVQMAHDHMHEVSALYGHVLKVKGATRVAAYGRQGAMLLFRTVGVRFAQRAVIKFAIPVIAIVMGGLLNFGLTLALGRHSDARFRKRAKIDDRLDRMLAHDDHCQRLLVSLMALMAGIDGTAHKNERELIMRTLDSLGVFGPDRAALLAQLIDDESIVLIELHEHPDDAFRGLVLEFMTLAAVVDGQVTAEEHAMLGRIALACGHDLDHDLLIDEHTEFLKRKHRKSRAART